MRAVTPPLAGRASACRFGSAADDALNRLIRKVKLLFLLLNVVTPPIN